MCHYFNSTVLLLKSFELEVTDQDSSVHCLISYKVKCLKSGRNEAYMNNFLFFHKMPLPYTATVKPSRRCHTEIVSGTVVEAIAVSFRK